MYDPAYGMQLFEMVRGHGPVRAEEVRLDMETAHRFAAQAEEALREGSVVRYILNERYRFFMRSAQSAESVEEREEARAGLNAVLDIEQGLRDFLTAYNARQEALRDAQ